MPNIIAHIGMALDSSSRLGHSTLEKNLGSFLLGSVSPDIRIITKGKRDDTHFTDLNFTKSGTGLERLFYLHPYLMEQSKLSEATKAFVVGYASHLLTDESWILNMYRPYFGNRQVFKDNLRGDLMDRALQLELDRQEECSIGKLSHLRPLLVDAEEHVEIEFIAKSTLTEWKDWVDRMFEWEFNWDRLGFMARRLINKGNNDSEVRINEMVHVFLQSVPEGLASIYELVPKDAFAGFREGSIEELLKFARSYLK